MKMRPLRDRILVERVEEQEQRIGGIVCSRSGRSEPFDGLDPSDRRSGHPNGPNVRVC